jgi:hypothetical protein
MKDLALSFVVFLITSTCLFAQYDQNEVLKEMQKMQEEMMKRFENLEFGLGDSQLFIDTFFIKEIDPNSNWMPLDPNSADLSKMMELLQKQMQQIDEEDWVEMEKLFKSFGDFSPTVPAPEESDKKEEGGNIIKKPNKKRKVYTL